MRLYCLIPCFVLAACGDNRNNSQPPDSHPPIDGAPDSPIDAAPDAPSGSQSRVWVIGDYLVDQKLVAGGFTDGATLPFGPSAPTPLLVPGGTSVLPSGTGFTTNVFDSNGTKTAFV